MTSTNGKIAKWNIDANAITDGNTGMGQGKTITANTFNNQFSAITNARFWSGTGANAVNYAVDSNGKLWSKSAQIGPWEVTNTEFTNGRTGMGTRVFSYSDVNIQFGDNSSANTTGRIWGVDASDKPTFILSSGGWLYARQGVIAGWHINGSKGLWAGNSSDNTKDNKYAGIRINANGSMNGGAGYNSGTGGSWAINSDGSSTFTNITTDHMEATNADVTGKIIANSGKIGNWTIDTGSISNNNLSLNSNGQISGSNWYITSSGANNLPISNVGLTSSGLTSSGSGGGGYLSSSVPVSGGNYSGGGGLEKWTEEIATDKITAKVAEISNLMFDTAQGGYLQTEGSIRAKNVIRADRGFLIGSTGGGSGSITVATGPTTTITLNFSGGLFTGTS